MAAGSINKIINYRYKMHGTSEAQRAMNMLKGAAVALTGAMVAITVSSVRVAGAFAEMENQFEVVFGDAAPEARAELDAFAESINRSSNRMVGYAAAIQDTFVPLGLMRDKAAELSLATVRLATDISSFKNLDMDQTVDRITSALAGQHRAVQQLGIIINQTNLAQELMNMGIMGGVQAATEAEKAQARLNIMFRASSDAIGDAERTSGEWTNQLRTLEDAWYDTRVEIGEEVIPILEELLPDILELMVGFKEMAVVAIPQMVEAFSKIAPTLIEAMGALSDFIGVVGKVIDFVAPALVDSLSELNQFAADHNTETLYRNLGGLINRGAELQGNIQEVTGVIVPYITELGSLAGGLIGVDTATEELTVSTDSLGGSVAQANDEFEKSIKLLREMSAEGKTPALEAEQVMLDSLAKRQLIVQEIGNTEMENARQVSDVLENAAYRFGQELRSGSLDALGIAKMIALELARAQIGKSLGVFGGPVLGFLGGLI